LIQSVLHNWPDTSAQTILRKLRDAATPDTKLLIAGYIIPLSCHLSDNSKVEREHDVVIEGASDVPPFPLLPNMGEANTFAYRQDMSVSI
jgi:hypothetical protein